MHTYIFIPPVKRPTGGVAVLYSMARALQSGGFPVSLAMRERPSWSPAGGPRSTGAGADPLAVVDATSVRLSPGDIWLVPEGWVNALAPGLKAGARCVVYCQNWAYLFSSLPAGVRWSGLPVSFLAVSQPVAMFIEQTLGVTSPILRPGIDLDVFVPGDKTGGPVRIAYMPRKNKALVDGIRDVWTARNPDSDVEWVEIAGLDRGGVASLLGSSHIFLATGFPEGCPLPPLEAMACGCLCVGFGGFGGWDYMRTAGEHAYRPWWPLRDVEWGSNGLWMADADVLGAALALERAVALWRSGGPELDRLLQSAAMTARAYGLEEHRRAVLAIWRLSGSLNEA